MGRISETQHAVVKIQLTTTELNEVQEKFGGSEALYASVNSVMLDLDDYSDMIEPNPELKLSFHEKILDSPASDWLWGYL